MNCADPTDVSVDYRWDLAEIKRLNRTADEVRALHERLVRQRVRFIVARLVDQTNGKGGRHDIDR